MKNNPTTISVLILTEINEFNELINPLDCMRTISKMFFDYVGSTIDQSFSNELTQIELILINQTLEFLNDCKLGANMENSLQLVVHNQHNRLYCRTALNKIFFKFIKNKFEDGECISKLDDIRNMEALFEFFNTIENIIDFEGKEQEIN